MTTADLLIALARANLAASAGVLVVLALRGPVRRAFGAHLGYALWLLAPAAAAGALMPAQDWWPGAVPLDGGPAGLSGSGWAEGLAVLWLAGLATSAALALWGQARFAAEVRAGRAGPAVVGVLPPRLVAPADIAQRFGEAERRLIRAHELAHIDRRDPWAGALAVIGAWICWFNPLAWLALAAFRRDQELACDATVMQRLPGARRAYAQTLLRSCPEAAEAIFGCHWRVAAHPLTTRLDMLVRRLPSQRRRDLGLAALVTLGVAGFGAAWAAQPAPPPAPAPATVMLVELAPADARQTAWVYRALPPMPAPR
jgi:beta-lactamase regulating signal transducer with metallopeptidase domain